MLQLRTKSQKEHIEKILCGTNILEIGDNFISFRDDGITFDKMAEIIDYIRTLDKKDDLFEECWLAYRRKGVKKKAKDQWVKLTEKEKDLVLPHIKAYVSSREIQYQKDFERYLRDKVFKEVVYSMNQVVYDPTKANDEETLYLPELSPSLMWNEYYKCWMYSGYFDGYISDGYDDNNRPNGVEITLNNGRGVIMWNKEQKQWIKK